MQCRVVPLQSSIAVMQCFVAPLQWPIASMQSSVVLLQSSIAVMQCPVAPLQWPIASMQSSVVLLQSSIAVMQCPVAPLQWPIASMQSSVVPLQPSIAVMQCFVAPLQRPAASMQCPVVPLQSSIAVMQCLVASVQRLVAVVPGLSGGNQGGAVREEGRVSLLRRLREGDHRAGVRSGRPMLLCRLQFPSPNPRVLSRGLILRGEAFPSQNLASGRLAERPEGRKRPLPRLRRLRRGFGAFGRSCATFLPLRLLQERDHRPGGI
jgi:hypothetical protein